VRHGTPPRLATERLRLLHSLATELLETKRLALALFERAVTALGTKAVVDAVGVLGYYALAALTLNARKMSLD